MRRLALFEFLNQLRAAHSPHHKISDEDIHHAVANNLQRLFAAAGGENFNRRAEVIQDAGQHRRRVRVIINDQDAHRGNFRGHKSFSPNA